MPSLGIHNWTLEVSCCINNSVSIVINLGLYHLSQVSTCVMLVQVVQVMISAVSENSSWITGF
jgi:hypothetical protein